MRLFVIVLACALVFVAFVSRPGICQVPKDRAASRSDQTNEAEKGDDNGSGVTEILKVAIEKAIEKGIEDVFATLKISDDIEGGLLNHVLSSPIKELGSPDAMTIVLLRPTETKESREVYEYRNDDQHFKLKMAKVRTRGVSRPIGVIVRTAVSDGQIIIEEWSLQLGRDGKWAKQ